MPKFITVADLVQKFAEVGIKKHPSTIYRWAEAGKLDSKPDPGGIGVLIEMNDKVTFYLTRDQPK